MPYSDYKIETFSGINDVATPPTSSQGCNGSYLVSQINSICDTLDIDISTLTNQVDQIVNVDIPDIQTSLTSIDISTLTNQVDQLVNVDIPDIQTSINNISSGGNSAIPSNFVFDSYDGLGTINFQGSQLELFMGDPRIKITSSDITINTISFIRDVSDSSNHINFIWSDYTRLEIATSYGNSISFLEDSLVLKAPPDFSSSSNKILLNSHVQFTGNIFDPNGNQILGIQRPAITNAAAGTEITTINAILSALRNHGLIAS